MKGGAFVSKAGHGYNELSKVGDEMSIKIGKSQKGLNVTNTSWGWPIGDCVHLLRVHGDSIR